MKLDEISRLVAGLEEQDLSEPTPEKILADSVQGLLAAYQNSDGALHTFVDAPRSTEARRNLPRLDMQAMVLRAWTARWEPSVRKEAGKEPEDQSKFPPLVLSWGNDSLRQMILNDLGLEPTQSGLWRYAEAHWSREVGTPPLLGEFLQQVGSDKASREVLNRFGNALLDIAVDAIGKTPAEIARAAPDPDGTAEWDEENDFQLQCRLVEGVDGQQRLILGGVLSPRAGVMLGPKDKAHAADLVGVWQLAEIASKEKITPRHLLAAQGVFVPVDRRRELQGLLDRWTSQAEVARLVARNLSHNMGSHALLHLRTRAGTTRAALDRVRPESVWSSKGALDDARGFLDHMSAFLEYLTVRSDLIALVAGGFPTGGPGLGLPLGAVLADFDDQTLLRELLCLSEGRKVDKLKVKGDPNEWVEIPAGSVGAHAFLAILENIARNSAKHSGTRKGTSVALQLNVGTRSSTLTKIEVQDRNAGPIDKEDVTHLNAISGPGFAGHREGGDEGLGVREMKAWAVFLAGGRFEEPNADALVFDTTKDGRLTTTFCLRKGRPFARLKSKTDPSAQFNLVEGPSAGSWSPKGRWIQIKGSGVETPFGNLPHTAVDEPELKTATEYPWRAAREIQRHWVESLRRRWAGPSEPSARLLIAVIFDGKDQFNPEPGFYRPSNDGSGLEFVEPGAEGRDSPELMVVVDRSLDRKKIVKRISDRLGDGDAVAVWDQHGRLLVGGGFAQLDEIGFPVVHYETGWSGSENKWLIPLLLSGSLFSPSVGIGLLAEAALTRVLVVDERLGKRFPLAHSARAAAAAAGVILYDPDDVASDEDWRAGLTSAGDAWGTTAQKAMLFAVESIHASIRRYAAFGSSAAEKKTKFRRFLEQRQGAVPALVLHSGKGGGFDGVEALPISMVERWGFSRRCKLLLTSSLYAGSAFRR